MKVTRLPGRIYLGRTSYHAAGLWKTYGRTIVQVLTACITIVLAVADRHVSYPEWAQVVVACGTTFAVHHIPNLPLDRGMKTKAALAGALANGAVTLTDQLTWTMCIALMFAILATLATHLAPSQGTGPAAEPITGIIGCRSSHHSAHTQRVP